MNHWARLSASALTSNFFEGMATFLGRNIGWNLFFEGPKWQNSSRAVPQKSPTKVVECKGKCPPQHHLNSGFGMTAICPEAQFWHAENLTSTVFQWTGSFCMTSYLRDFLFADVSKLGTWKFMVFIGTKNSSSGKLEVPILRHVLFH